jgi:hypothetical protein
MRRIAVLTALLLSTACGARQKPLPPGPGRDTPAPAVAGTPRPGETVRELDLDHDGHADVWSYSVKGATGAEVLVRKEKDLDRDGRIDCWEAYDPDGGLARQAYDMDLDGTPDLALDFEKDRLVRKEHDFGSDGLPRTVGYYGGDGLVRRERDTDRDGQIDTWEYWRDGEVDRIGVDLDGDGQVDRWEIRPAAPASGLELAPPR